MIGLAAFTDELCVLEEGGFGHGLRVVAVRLDVVAVRTEVVVTIRRVRTFQARFVHIPISVRSEAFVRCAHKN